jgi:phage-related protein
MQSEQQKHLDGDHCVASLTDHRQHDFLSLEDVPDQIYLAQVQTPI